MAGMLAGATALVTGGSGAIGSAICQALASHGAAVAFTYFRHPDKAMALSAELEQAGCKCVAGQVDASSAPAVQEFVGRVESELGRVDVLVNNIGGVQAMPFALIEEADWDQVISVNLKSLFLFTKAVVRGMIRRRAGVVLNLGSVGGHRLLEVPVHYATAKAGVTGFTLALAKELSRYGIRVNEVVPGLIEGGIGNNITERQLEDYKKFCTLGRAGRPEEVAELIAFLASSRAAYINAQSIVVDGGL